MGVTPFTGAKIVLHHRGQLLTHLRDDLAGLLFANHWDLPGGGREDNESPLHCALRETHEEYGLTLPPDRVTYLREYPPRAAQNLPSWFAAAPITAAEIVAIRFGDEGQYWRLMQIDDYLTHPQAVPHFQSRIRDWLATSPLLSG